MVWNKYMYPMKYYGILSTLNKNCWYHVSLDLGLDNFVLKTFLVFSLSTTISVPKMVITGHAYVPGISFKGILHYYLSTFKCVLFKNKPLIMSSSLSAPTPISQCSYSFSKYSELSFSLT